MNDEDIRVVSPMLDSFLADLRAERMNLQKAINDMRTDIYQHRRHIESLEESIKAAQERIVIIDHLRLFDNDTKKHFEEKL